VEKNFKREKDLKTHPRTKETRFTKCEPCNRGFKNKAFLLAHEARGHCRVNRQVVDVECPICLMKVRNTRLLPHLRLHTNEFSFTCCVCQRGFHSLRPYVKHCEREHSKTKVAKWEGQRKCFLCNTICNSRDDFFAHRRKYHRNVCIFCNERFPLKRFLDEHYKEKHREKMLSCDHCTKMFPTERLLKEHKNYYRFRQPKTCSICGLVVSQMRVHMIQNHADGKHECECDKCGLMLRNRIQLSRHMRVKHNDGKHICVVCSKVYPSDVALTRHLRYTHFGEKNHVCSTCGKSFSKKSHLKFHERIHSEMKMFVCTFCGQGFNYKVSLQTHTRSKHPESMEDI